MILRDGRGRIRCYACTHWASRWTRAPTQWSVCERVPVCWCCFNWDWIPCEGGDK